MGSKRNEKGGSVTTSEDSLRRRHKQVPQDWNPRKGVKLLPGVEFQFTEEQKELLGKSLEFPQDKIDLFLNEVENHLSKFLSTRIQTDGLPSPRELYKSLSRLQAQVEALLQSFADFDYFEDHYSSKKQILTDLIGLESRALGYRSGYLQGCILDLFKLRNVLKRALSQEKIPIPKSSWTISNQELANNIYATFLNKARDKVTPKMGRPRKKAEVRLIANIADSYEDHFGKPPPKGMASQFQSILYLAAEFAGIEWSEDCSRLTKEALRDF